MKKKTLEEKFSSVENEVCNVEEKIVAVDEKLTKRVQDLEKKLSASSGNYEEFRNLPASPVHVKLSTYDGKSSWQVYKTQFAIVAEANKWSDEVKACQMAASLRGEAADVLQTLPDLTRLNFETLSCALEMRFGEKFFKDYTRIQILPINACLVLRYLIFGNGL